VISNTGIMYGNLYYMHCIRKCKGREACSAFGFDSQLTSSYEVCRVVDCIHTLARAHAHTHTHIYIYIYMYIFVFAK
jgi:hypothetical protein